MQENILDELQIYREQIMNQNIWNRNYERALQKYDELAIRLDQIRKVLALFD